MRGRTATIGDTRVSKNGYHYTKVDGHPLAPNGWILTHWLTAEQSLGRPLTDNESVRFKEPKYKKDPTNPNGIVVIRKRTASLRKRLAIIDDRLRELEAEKKLIEKQLEGR